MTDTEGVKVTIGTIVDATIIAAPSSTKNVKKERDPEMHQTKKGNEQHFSMKAHLGVDSKTKLIHSLRATPANVADSALLGDLCTAPKQVYGATKLIGVKRRLSKRKHRGLEDHTHRRYRREGAIDGGVVNEEERTKNRTKSKVRAKVERPFLIIKRVFSFAKVRCSGLKKNTNRLFVACGLCNLFLWSGVCPKRHFHPQIRGKPDEKNEAIGQKCTKRPIIVRILFLNQSFPKEAVA